MTADSNGTADKASSGKTAGTSNVRYNSHGRPIYGKTDEIGDLMFRQNVKDQVDLFIKTRDAIADHVLRLYGNNMYREVRHYEETTLTEPKYPKAKGKDATPSQADVDMFKLQYAEYRKDLRELQRVREQTWGIVKGQCSLEVKVALESDTEYPELEKSCDVAGLMMKLEELAHSTKSNRHKVLSAARGLKRLINLSQGQKESNTHYLERCNAIANVVLAQCGMPVFPKLRKAETEAATTECWEQFLAMIYLDGACPLRYGSLKAQLNNEMIAGKDNYPETPLKVLERLSNYENDRNGSGNSSDKRSGGNIRVSIAVQSAICAKIVLSRRRITTCKCKEHKFKARRGMDPADCLMKVGISSFS